MRRRMEMTMTRQPSRAAMAYLSSSGGGTLHFSAGKRYRCTSTISIPDNCGIDGGLSSPGFVPDLNYAAKAGSLLLSENASVSLGNSTGFRNLRIVNAGITYPCPVLEHAAAAQVKAFSGTAIVDSGNS